MASPDGVCYSCGSALPEGLQLKSYWHEDGVHVVCTHTPDPKLLGWPELVCGGLLAMLVDCHSNWTAIAYHYRAEGREPGSLPRIDGVTGKLNLTYIKPTLMSVELTLKARVEGVNNGVRTCLLPPCELLEGVAV